MQEKIEAVQRMQDYIEAHLLENITMAKLAKVALYSPWYAYQLFKEHTGLTPATYIRRFRLAKSVLMLRDAKPKVAENCV